MHARFRKAVAFPREHFELGAPILLRRLFAVRKGNDLIFIAVQNEHGALIRIPQGRKRARLLKIPLPQRHAPQVERFGDRLPAEAPPPVVGDAEGGIEQHEPRDVFPVLFRHERRNKAPLAAAEEEERLRPRHLLRLAHDGNEVFLLRRERHVCRQKAAFIARAAAREGENDRPDAVFCEKFGKRRKVARLAVVAVRKHDHGEPPACGEIFDARSRPPVMRHRKILRRHMVNVNLLATMSLESIRPMNAFQSFLLSGRYSSPTPYASS